MKSLIFLIVLASLSGLVLLGCGEISNQGNQGQEVNGGEAEVGQNVGQEEVVPEQADCSEYPFEDKVCNLIASGELVHCTFTRNEKETEMWLKAGNLKVLNLDIRFKGVILTEKGLMNVISHINKKDMTLKSYTWKEGAGVGIRMESELSSAPATAGAKSYEENSMNVECERASEGDDILNPPSDVTFVTTQEMMQNPELAKQMFR